MWMAFRLGERTCCSIAAGLPRDGLSKSPGSDVSSRVVYAKTFLWYIYGVLSDERQTSIPDLIDRSDQIDVLMRGN